jgi:hypothetical protein
MSTCANVDSGFRALMMHLSAARCSIISMVDSGSCVSENSAVAAQLFQGMVPIAIRPLSTELAISRVKYVDLFIIC